MQNLKQILVVDDDSSMVQLLRDFLVMQGYKVATTSSVAGAIHWMTQTNSGAQRLDLVLSDVKLGTASGIDLARKLNTEHPELPVVLFSVMEDHAEEALKSGARKFLRKPFPLSLLAQVLKEELKKK